jgi:hypothetical protein
VKILACEVFVAQVNRAKKYPGVAHSSKHLTLGESKLNQPNISPFNAPDALIYSHSFLSMDGRARLYVIGAFALGVLLTLGYKDVYPDLEQRFRRRRRRFSIVDARSAKVELRDETQKRLSELPVTEIPEGIEGLIGNTPLFKIKSLSEATGCEILAKAEVWLWKAFKHVITLTYILVSQWSRK